MPAKREPVEPEVYDMDPVEPEVYDFKNWPAFYYSTLRYHKATQPNDDTVNGRIKTFRKYMSPSVVELLGVLVKPRERYDTSDGWDDWAGNVGLVLRTKDSSAKQPVTAAGCIGLFQQGETDECTLWSQLEICASEGEITDAQQREMFWATVSPEIRNRLTAQSPYFDPDHNIWLEKDSPNSRRAQQVLPRKIAVLKLEKEISWKRTSIALLWCVFLLLISLCALCVSLVVLGYEPPIMGAIIFFIFSLWSLTMACLSHGSLWELRRTQKGYQALGSEVERDRQVAPAASDPDRVLLA